MNIKEAGQKFVDALVDVDIKLEENEDGRLESQGSENFVTDYLRSKFADQITFLPKGHNRDFGDITIVLGGKEYPINIKMVGQGNSYNAGGPKLFNYILFDKTTSQWQPIVKNVLKEKPTTIKNDYYYLIIYKRSDKKSQFFGLAEVDNDSVITNPSNPIQFKYNLKTVTRSQKEKANFILKLFKEILQKKAEPYLMLEGIE
tara:strand:+ start:105 stop:710 length:606 start_codon:yes stop_codon:yes gene_type:complete